MLTIIHAADFHLDSPFSGLAPEAAAARRSEQRLLLEDLVDLARREQAHAVLLSGDILDAQRCYPQTVRALSQALGQMPCPVFLAPGNHDPYTAASPYASAQWPENVHIFKDSVERFDLPEHNCAVYGWGFPAAHAEVSPLRGFHVEDPEKLNLMCLHGDLNPNSPYAPIAQADVLGSGLTYLALGHIHKRLPLTRCGTTWLAYPGCPEGRGFDETGEKGALVLRITPNLVTEKFVPLCRHRYETVSVDVTGRNPLTALMEVLPADAAPHAYRVTLTGESGGLDLPALHAALSSRFSSLELLDRTRLPQDLWQRRREESLTGLTLTKLWEQCQADPENETLQLAARFAFAALEGGEDAAP